MKPADIRKHWDFMRQKIEEMFACTDQKPEEVYAACRYGKASLYVADDGFVVLRPYENRSTSEPHAFIWVAWCDGGNAIERYHQQLVEIAKSAGATKLVFETNRSGFDRALPSGWTKTMITHELRI